MNLETSAPPGEAISLGVGLALCSISGVMSAIVMVPIMPEIFRIFGSMPHAAFWLPALVTIPGFCAALLSPAAGFLGDKISLKWPIVGCLLFYALFGFLPFLSQDFKAILASRIALGISQVGVLMFSLSLIGQQFDGPQRDKWLAVQAAAATSSSIVLLPISGFLAASQLGWNGSFLIYLSAVALAIFFAVQPIRTLPSVLHDGSGSSRMPWRWLLEQCSITCFGGVLVFAAQFQIGLAFATVGIKSVSMIGILSAIAVAGVVVGSLLFMKAKNALGERLLISEVVVCGVTLIAMWRIQSPPAILCFAFINMVACGLLLPTLVTTVADGLPDAVRGRGLGVWNSAFVLAQFLSSTFVGSVLAIPGRTVLDAFGLLGVVALTLAFGFAVWRRLRRVELTA